MYYFLKSLTTIIKVNVCQMIIISFHIEIGRQSHWIPSFNGLLKDGDVKIFKTTRDDKTVAIMPLYKSMILLLISPLWWITKNYAAPLCIICISFTLSCNRHHICFTQKRNYVFELTSYHKQDLVVSRNVSQWDIKSWLGWYFLHNDS